jgi:hypothetical protein
MRMRSQSGWVMLLVSLAVLLPAWQGRANPESNASWSAVVESFRQVLAGEIASSNIDELVTSSAWMQSFDRSATASATNIVRALPRQQVVSARAYQLSDSMDAVRNLSEDLLAASVDESTRQQLVPPDEESLRRAERAFYDWIAISLDTHAGDPIACIVLYDSGVADIAAGRSARAPSVSLMIARGETVDNSVRISRILFGSIDDAAR